MERTARAILIGGGLLLLGLALGFATEQNWATSLWPNPNDTPLSHTFVASMQAAIAAAMLWIGLSGALHAIAAGSLNLMVMFGGMSVSLVRTETLLGDQALLYAAGCFIFALFNAVLFFWASRLPERSQVPTPEIVRWSFGLFVIALASVGALLIAQTKEIMPWDLVPLTSILIGWMFFGDAFYFLYGLVYPRWINSAAQLWSFLAYDLILIVPLLARLAKIIEEPDKWPQWMFNSVIVYIAVLLFSLTLAINFLLLHPETGIVPRLRIGRRR